jgi:hypothetical protein
MRHWLRYWEVALFLSSGAVLAFLVGQLFALRGWWPTRPMEHANIAVEELRDEWRAMRRERSEYLQPTKVTKPGLQHHDPGLAWPGYTFITAYRDGRFGASLLNMEGETVHRWDVAVRDVYNEPPPHLAELPDEAEVNIHGSVMQPNGDITINLYMTGTIRLDRCSRIVWTLPRGTHHSIDLLPDERLLMPVRGPDGRAVDPRTPRVGPGKRGFYYVDNVLMVDAAGRPIDEIPLLQSIHAGGFGPALVAGVGHWGRVFHEDPLHLNDAEWLRPELADAFPLFEAGDIMVSMRSMSTVMVIDGRSKLVKWSTSGQFHRQHDPDFMPNGHILMFDNAVAAESRRVIGRSRVIELDPVSQRIVWSYDGGDANPFYVYGRGTQQLLPNGNVLIVDPDAGRVFEVARQRGDGVVWDYVNLVEPGFAGVVLDAARHDAAGLDFIGKPCP